MASKTLLRGALLLSLAVAQPAAAQTAPLAPGETPLTISARSTVRTPPDLVLLQVRVSARGASQAEARKLADEKVQRIIAGLVSKGVRREDVIVTTEPQPALAINAVDEIEMVAVAPPPPPVVVPPAPKPSPVVVSSAPPPPPVPVLMTPSPASARRASATSTIKMSLQSTSQYTVAQEVLSREDVYVGAARLSLRDDRQAKRAAIAQAIAKARDEADIYAAAVGMRVTRVTKISNEMPIGTLAVDVDSLVSRRAGSQEEVATDAAVTIEFAMAPK